MTSRQNSGANAFQIYLSVFVTCVSLGEVFSESACSFKAPSCSSFIVTHIPTWELLTAVSRLHQGLCDNCRGGIGLLYALIATSSVFLLSFWTCSLLVKSITVPHFCLMGSSFLCSWSDILINLCWLFKDKAWQYAYFLFCWMLGKNVCVLNQIDSQEVSLA